MSSDDDFELSEIDQMEVEAENNKRANVNSSSKEGRMQEIESPSFEKGSKEGRKSLTVEEKYQKLDQREHVLKRPDMYIGSIEKVTQEMWVFDENTKGLQYRSVTYVPGFLKIFDEILVNAADNKQNDPSMDTIRVDIDRENCRITIWNNGKGIPVVIHKTHKMYVPSLIFGLLLTGGNFDDNERKVTGGRNGLGAKLTNIYSKEFSVETADKLHKRSFHQDWYDHMSRTNDPNVKDYRGKEFTQISYIPDLSLFKMDSLDDDAIALMKKRVYDIAGVTDSSLKVYLNGELVEVKDFKSYIKMYRREDPSGDTEKIAFCKAGERWEVGIGVSDGHLQQVSFVNSICTSNGGKHVDYIAQKITEYLLPLLKKKTKKDVKPLMVKQFLYIFVNCKIENPTFDSQTKETLTKVSKDWGSLPEFNEAFLKKVEKCGILDSVTSYSQFKEDQMVKKHSGKKTTRKLNIPKLDDANFAGTRQSSECTLIITEGDSAKSLVISGLSIIGRDYYGVFPLRGKMLNVRDVSKASAIKNDEIRSLVQILGLQFDKVYKDVSSLRYGKLVIMADQDYDGSHIKGLVINFFQVFWPSLLKLDFLQQFITPIVKATKGNKSYMFFTLQQYKNWLVTHNEGKDYYIKYYKGLGTSSPEEGREYFSRLSRHLVPFKPITEDETLHLDMVFRRKRVTERKIWINQYHPGDFVDYAVDRMAYIDFLDKELIQYSRYDNTRSIPCVVDGFKPSQRKVLFGAFKRNLTSEIKVIQFTGYISEHAAYHHGEQSLNDTIIGMAQDFVGSNNINLLFPAGQFGSRLLGGKDAASARYIYTRLSKITRKIFIEDDDLLCHYLVDEGQSVEPEYYLPIIPMVLVNGSEGIGTGYSTKIPNYNPVDVANYIKAKLHNEKVPELHPWWRGFTGDIFKRPNGYLIRGKITKVDELTYVITELPIGRWTQDYKQILTDMLLSEKRAPLIADFRENHTDTTVHFTVLLTPEQARALEGQDLYKFFRLESTVTTSNFNLFSPTGQITRYTSAQHIMEEFFAFRLPYFQQRKDFLTSKLSKEIVKVSNIARFVTEVVEGELIINNRPQKEILLELQEKGYDMILPEKKKISSTTGDVVIAERTKSDDNEVSVSEASIKELANGYSYLINLKVWSLTKELVEKIQRDVANLNQRLEQLRETTPEMMWDRDLDAFLETLMEMEQERINKKLNDAKNRKKAEAERTGSSSRRSDAGFLEEFSDEDDEDDEQMRRGRRKVKKTAKEKALDELKQKTNTVTSRFSISDYYRPQLKEPTPEMLRDLDAAIDEETGEIVKVKKEKEKKPRGAAKKGDGKRVEKEPSMVLESDSEEISDSEDDVIRDNRAAIAARQMEEEAAATGAGEARGGEGEEMEVEDEPVKKTAAKGTKKGMAGKTTRKGKAAKKVAQMEEEHEEEEEKEKTQAKNTKKTTAKGRTTKRVALMEQIGDDDEEEKEEKEKQTKTTKAKTTKAKTTKTTKTKTGEEETESTPARKRGQTKKTAAASTQEAKKDSAPAKKSSSRVAPISSDSSDESDEDGYVPLAERLKMSMKDDARSTIVDELANTKSTIPASRKRKATKKVDPPKKKPKVSKDSDSSDSLFGF